MILGFRLSGPDNDSFMLRGDVPHPACSGCELPTDASWVDPSFRLGRRDLDASYTYDGYFIVSDRFRAAAGDRGASYVALQAEPGFSALIAHRTVEFDTARRRTRLERRCPVCERFFAVAGARPVMLRKPDPLPPLFLRTDVEFGTGPEQHPLVLVGNELAELLRKASLKGLELEPVEA